MIDVIGYDTDVNKVNTIIRHLKRYVYYPAKGDIRAVFYKNVNGQKIIISDKSELVEIKLKIKQQMIASIEVLGFATLYQMDIYKQSKLDYLKDKCYKYLEASLDLPKGTIAKSD